MNGDVLERFSVGQYTTRSLTFEEDLAALVMGGAAGVGIDAGLKLTGATSELAMFRESPLSATLCFPTVPSILPAGTMPGPGDPAARTSEMCTSIRQLAPFDPVCLVCVPGPIGTYGRAEARAIAVDGLREAASVAADFGLTLALEPMHSSLETQYSFLTDIPDAIELLDEIGAPNTGLVFDVWHLWDTTDVVDLARKHATRFVGVHVDDWRSPTRSWCDRVLPGDGIADVVGIIAALEEGGFNGWYELEIFSDDGTYGNNFRDSLWKRDPVELIVEGREKFFRLWQAASSRLDDGRDAA